MEQGSGAKHGKKFANNSNNNSNNDKQQAREGKLAKLKVDVTLIVLPQGKVPKELCKGCKEVWKATMTRYQDHPLVDLDMFAK
jgi:hypothetical protein